VIFPSGSAPWQTVWKRHHRFATDGTWDMLLRVIQSEADAAGRVDWSEIQRPSATTRNWTGGFYELAIERGDRDDARLEAALQRAWADPSIDGCFIERNREPDDQSRVAPTLEAQNKSGHLRGISPIWSPESLTRPRRGAAARGSARCRFLLPSPAEVRRLPPP